MHRFLLPVLFLGLVTTQAQAGTKFSLLFSPTYSLPQPASSFTGGTGLASGGLTLEFGKRIGFEIGAFYQTLMFNNFQTSNISVPLGLRLWATRWITLSAGGFARYATRTLATRKTLDYGPRATVGLNIPVKGRFNLVLEGGVEYGMADQSTAATTSTNVVGFANIGIRIGEVLKK